MAITTVNPGDIVLASDVNQYKNHIEGATTGTYLFKTATATSFQIQLVDAAGATYFRILDSTGAAVFTVDSDGNVIANGSLTSTGSLVLPVSATPSQTADGATVWDSDDNILTIGDGASRQTFYPGSEKYKIKTAQQTFTTTTYAPVTATTGNIAFAVEANKAYRIDIELAVGGVGTQNSGGFKMQLTGPAAPTRVLVHAQYPWTFAQGADNATNTERSIDGYERNSRSVTAFDAFIAVNAAPTTAPGSASGLRTGVFTISIFLINGTTAGTVTLEAAQNTAAGTSSIESGFATMTEVRAE